MDFTEQEILLLRQYSGKEFPVVVKFMNRLGQEVSFKGFIPYAYKKYEGDRSPNSVVTEKYVIVNFGSQDFTDVKIYAPQDELHSVTLERIETETGFVLYENENYYLRKWDIRAIVEDNYGDENHFTTSAPHWNELKKLLGKVVVYKGNHCPDLFNKECLIMNIGRGHAKYPDDIRFTVKNGPIKFNTTININDFDKYFEIVDVYNSCEFNF